MKAELCNLTRLQDMDKKVTFMLKFLEKIHAGFEKSVKLDSYPNPDPKKNHFGFTTLPKIRIF
jgi:hypothetical protein